MHQANVPELPVFDMGPHAENVQVQVFDSQRDEPRQFVGVEVADLVVVIGERDDGESLVRIAADPVLEGGRQILDVPA